MPARPSPASPFELASPPAGAPHTRPQDTRSGRPVPGGTALVFGAGFTRDPDTHLFGASADFPLGDFFTIGPAVHVGVDDERTLVSPMVQFKRFFPLDARNEFTSRFVPFAQVAAGAAFLESDPDGPAPDVDDEGFLIGFGGGARYAFTDRISIGSQVQFNFLPGEVLDEDLYVSWEIAQLVLTF